MPTVSAISVIDLSNELYLRGALDEPALTDIYPKLPELSRQLRQNCLPPEILEQRLSEQYLIQLWQAVNSEQYPDIGLDIGNTVTPSAAGLLSNWISSCVTLGEALDVFTNNIGLLNASENWQIHHRDDQLVFEFGFINQSAYPDIAIDRSLSAMLAWASYWSGQKIRPLHAGFTRPMPANEASIKQCFGDKLSFSADSNFAVVKREVLDKPITSSNAYIKSLLKQRATTLKSQLCDSEFQHRVLRLLNKDLAHYCHIDTVCRELHISRSSLYRELKRENTHFSRLLKITRSAHYKQASQDKLSTQALCDLLGYKDISTFYKARKRGDLNHSE